MKTVSFSFVAKFPSKKVTDSFTNPAFAKLHTASKLFGKTGIYKADKKMIVRTLPITGADKAALPVVAVITFADADSGASTAISATFVNVPDNKAEAIKGLGKIIAEDLKKYLTPKPVAAKPVAKKPAAKKAAAKPAAKKPAAKKAAAKPVAKKPVAKKAAAKPAAKKPVAKKAAAKPAAKAAVTPTIFNPAK